MVYKAGCPYSQTCLASQGHEERMYCVQVLLLALTEQFPCQLEL